MPIRSDVRNRLLRSLHPDDFNQLGAHLEHVDLPARKTLAYPNEPIRSVYFVEAGLVSIVSILADGQRIEVGVAGREGMVGVPLLLGAEAMPLECVVQIPSTAWRVDAAAFWTVIRQRPSVHVALLRYALAFLVQVAQTATCNGAHTIRQRLARWLLMAHDRSDDDEIRLTQEIIATMLGVRRAGVTVAAGTLQKAGLIACGKGSITIVDRLALEAASCECYAIVKEQTDRLLPERSDPP